MKKNLTITIENKETKEEVYKANCDAVFFVTLFENEQATQKGAISNGISAKGIISASRSLIALASETTNELLKSYNEVNDGE